MQTTSVVPSADVHPLRQYPRRADRVAMRIAPLSERTLWTVADVDALPDDGNRYELLHGDLLVTPLPSSRHQGIAGLLYIFVTLWRRANIGWRVLAPGGMHFSETN